MLQKLNKNRGGFTLVEIMIVVAIIALLAAIAVPNFLRARKRSQATRVLEDLRMVDSAIDQYAIENNKAGGAAVIWADIQAYLKQGTTLYTSTGRDLLGNQINGGTFTVDGIPRVAANTFRDLSDVAPAAFWSPFAPAAVAAN
jgi:prepilin-type N-terminal cleavage/methylation domain-containing protein